MPKGIYIRSEKNLEKLKLSRLGKNYDEIFGEERAKEIKEKMRKSSIGKKHKPLSLETRKRMSLARKRRGEYSLETRKKISLSNIGKHYHSEETRKKISLNHRHYQSLEARNKISKGNKGKKYPIESYPNKGTRSNILPLKDTKIELKIQDFLKKIGIEFYTHFWINEIEHKYKCDIFIPLNKTIIECDGDYFHANPRLYKDNDKIRDGTTAKELWERDRIRTQELQEKGYRVIRLWECEIKSMNLEQFKEIITKYKSKEELKQ